MGTYFPLSTYLRQLDPVFATSVGSIPLTCMEAGGAFTARYRGAHAVNENIKIRSQLKLPKKNLMHVRRGRNGL